jgi:hypothetical protein
VTTPFGPDFPDARYYRDNVFRVLVDSMEALLMQAQCSPSEMREAATLACIHYESKRPPVAVIYVRQDGTAWRPE